MPLGRGGLNVVYQKMGKPKYSSMPDKNYSAKKARKGRDLGKKGKNFAKIAASAGARYGSAEAGKRVAGAILRNLRNKRG